MDTPASDTEFWVMVVVMVVFGLIGWFGGVSGKESETWKRNNPNR